MEIKKIPLEKDEYYQEIFEKDTIVIHHTAGSHRADWTVACWEHDKNKAGLSLKVATSYIVGGISTRDVKDVAFLVFLECKNFSFTTFLKSSNSSLTSDILMLAFSELDFIT